MSSKDLQFFLDMSQRFLYRKRRFSIYNGVRKRMAMGREDIQFKRVPALDKGFAILNLLAKNKQPLGITDLSKALHYNKGTVFNIVHTMTDLGVLDRSAEGKFQLGLKMYILGRAGDRNSHLIQTVHPYLKEINQKTKLSAFLGIRSGLRAVIIDKVDTAFDIKIHSEIGMSIPLLAGAGGRVLLCQLSDAEIDDVLSKNSLKGFAPNACLNKRAYKEMIKRARKEGIAMDDEEYIEGIRALAVPLRVGREDLQAAIWAVGLKRLLDNRSIAARSNYLKGIARNIEKQCAVEEGAP